MANKKLDTRKNYYIIFCVRIFLLLYTRKINLIKRTKMNTISTPRRNGKQNKKMLTTSEIFSAEKLPINPITHSRLGNLQFVQISFLPTQKASLFPLETGRHF